ncbi:hypothetical protein KSP40_PGU015041 [Platanthera guangdongensis]|uniref:Bulb-type lectin domain-containing protein n=1 Tax=Platanthera guangdongensis TaxID=2320717 RepID=A0ABR2M496_9ASPA
MGGRRDRIKGTTGGRYYRTASERLRAERDSAVGKDATVKLYQRGNLLLLYNNTVIWTSNTIGLGIQFAFLSDSDNFILPTGGNHPQTSLGQLQSSVGHSPYQPASFHLARTHINQIFIRLLLPQNALAADIAQPSPNLLPPSRIQQQLLVLGQPPNLQCNRGVCRHAQFFRRESASLPVEQQQQMGESGVDGVESVPGCLDLRR